MCEGNTYFQISYKIMHEHIIAYLKKKSHRLREKKKRGLFCSKTSRNDKDKHTGFHIYRNVLDYI